jgi:hypothetical protein
MAKKNKNPKEKATSVHHCIIASLVDQKSKTRKKMTNTLLTLQP